MDCRRLVSVTTTSKNKVLGGVKGQYFNAKANAPIVDTTWNHIYTTDAKGWMATVDYALQNNVGLSAYYGFDWKDQAGNDLNDFYRADLNYKF